MAKSVEAFRNIGEVADELDVKKHVLRFWEVKFPQLKPMKRGGGRRLYRPSDVALLRGIRDLLQDAGYTIKGVQKILREQGIEHVKIAIDAHAASRAKGGAESGPKGGLKNAGLEENKSDANDGVGALKDASGAAILLDAQQLKALRNVLGELKACQALLAETARKSMQ